MSPAEPVETVVHEFLVDCGATIRVEIPVDAVVVYGELVILCLTGCGRVHRLDLPPEQDLRASPA